MTRRPTSAPGATRRRSSANTTSIGPMSRMRDDLAAAAITPPDSPICCPTATALERIVDGQAAPESCVPGVEPDQRRDGVKQHQRHDAEQEHGTDGDALLFPARPDDRGQRVHGGRPADHRPAGEQVRERAPDPQRRRDGVRHEERARHARAGDHRDEQQLGRAEEVRLQLQAHEHDRQAQQPLAGEDEAIAVRIGGLRVGGSGEAQGTAQRADVDEDRAEDQGQQDVRDQRGRWQSVRDREGSEADGQREREAG